MSRKRRSGGKKKRSVVIGVERARPDFRGIPLSKKAARAMEAALVGQHRLQFVVRWITQRPVVLLSLQIRIGSQAWRELLTQALGENDGHMVVEMGLYPPSLVTIRFALGALTSVPKAATYIVEDEQKVTQFKPPAGTTALTQGQMWKEEGAYAIGVAP